MADLTKNVQIVSKTDHDSMSVCELIPVCDVPNNSEKAQDIVLPEDLPVDCSHIPSDENLSSQHSDKAELESQPPPSIDTERKHYENTNVQTSDGTPLIITVESCTDSEPASHESSLSCGDDSQMKAEKKQCIRDMPGSGAHFFTAVCEDLSEISEPDKSENRVNSGSFGSESPPDISLSDPAENLQPPSNFQESSPENCLPVNIENGLQTNELSECGGAYQEGGSDGSNPDTDELEFRYRTESIFFKRVEEDEMVPDEFEGLFEDSDSECSTEVEEQEGIDKEDKFGSKEFSRIYNASIIQQELNAMIDESVGKTNYNQLLEKVSSRGALETANNSKLNRNDNPAVVETEGAAIPESAFFEKCRIKENEVLTAMEHLKYVLKCDSISFTSLPHIKSEPALLSLDDMTPVEVASFTSLPHIQSEPKHTDVNGRTAVLEAECCEIFEVGSFTSLPNIRSELEDFDMDNSNAAEQDDNGDISELTSFTSLPHIESELANTDVDGRSPAIEIDYHTNSETMYFRNVAQNESNLTNFDTEGNNTVNEPDWQTVKSDQADISETVSFTSLPHIQSEPTYFSVDGRQPVTEIESCGISETSFTNLPHIQSESIYLNADDSTAVAEDESFNVGESVSFTSLPPIQCELGYLDIEDNNHTAMEPENYVVPDSVSFTSLPRIQSEPTFVKEDDKYQVNFDSDELTVNLPCTQTQDGEEAFNTNNCIQCVSSNFSSSSASPERGVSS